MNQQTRSTWDIFCRVVDNYGDIGICWRLARQLADEYPIAVRLWVDELVALTHICPTAVVAEQQWIGQVDVRAWREPFTGPVEPANVVIEAFACELPQIYLDAMKSSTEVARWINLEYLSAESWVEDCHGMQSIHPVLGLKKTFFFPGFSTKTGGVIRERGLAEQRDNFIKNGHKAEFLTRFGLEHDTNNLLVSLFGYENNAVGALLDAWQNSTRNIICLVPAGKILSNINNYLDTSLKTGDVYANGTLMLKVIPFMQQQDYDRLLWACDINFVRGEDSFIRAQWAAKPLIWNIYPQDEDAHLEKLAAFLQRYNQGLSPALQIALNDLWHGWNRDADCRLAWNQCIAGLSEWQFHSKRWEQQLNSSEDLAAKLVLFCEKPL